MRPTITYLSTISFYRVIYFTRIQDDRTIKVLTIPRETNPNTDDSKCGLAASDIFSSSLQMNCRDDLPSTDIVAYENILL